MVPRASWRDWFSNVRIGRPLQLILDDGLQQQKYESLFGDGGYCN